ncbi:hydrogenase expression/formation protein HypE [Geomonas nitrogeniifigens]|uniref:Hydrogenase expression/formation protein HypE n=1 Tax=Geomonas diazotrophica TaxID=2843197 RepID=A0ABX8JKL6_9BACT|nr:hydrogenase expression/formation protein HypE [Geomonas nitrogeniifigens]QWV98526.1 hydrogenase expression/formation protein HypE [Geomonas nitrogeniifigens]QXE87709.1 hydrogenase expression/formation protein HypE [Geomonas nitrogeniifigens]
MNNDLILLGHGSGGRLSHQLLEELIIPQLSSVPVAGQNDAALLNIGGIKLAFSTDSYVVDPIFFPGGNIGDLAINGTVNDLAMMGARPLCLSVGFILEEGFSKEELARILASMREAAEAAGVAIVTGDTKVVPKGKGDRIFINTSGIGAIEHNLQIDGASAQVGDKVIVNGCIGDHGIAVLSAREGLEIDSGIQSDSAALNGLVTSLLPLGSALHVLRDPTRGGVATTLKEIALQSGVTVTLDEKSLPINPGVKGVCSILGLDPLYVANEGKLLAFVAPERAEEALAVMRRHPLGEDAAVIGEVTGTSSGKVQMETVVGGVRGVEMLAGEQLPRIC